MGLDEQQNRLFYKLKVEEQQHLLDLIQDKIHTPQNRESAITGGYLGGIVG